MVMEVPNVEGDEMPIPLNSTYGGEHGHAHMIHHHHHDQDHHHPPPSHNHIIIPSSAAVVAAQIPSPTTNGVSRNLELRNAGTALPTTVMDDFKKIIRYRECLKNHAASIGGNATDGCGEFMPSGDEGTLEALTCSACHCHRNFHRKETDGACYHNPMIGRKLFLGHHHHKGYAAAHQMIMPYNMGGGGGESDEQDGLMVRPSHVMKKRFRTKFSQEQKEKMLKFAEKVGWKIQKQEEGVVQQFCQEIGVKRRVLKVWMHNNKHTLAKKNNLQSDPQIQSLGTD